MTVGGGGCNKSWPWVVQNLETANGIEFIQLSKRDTGFHRFVSGKVAGARDMDFLDHLRSLRQLATLQACREPGPVALFDAEAPPSKAAHKKAKREATQSRERGDMPSVVTLELPGFTDVDGQQVLAISARVKSGIDTTANVWLEFTTAALDYLRRAMVASDSSGRKQRTKQEPGVSWRQSRKRFIAVRVSSSGSKSQKTFAPDNSDTEGMEQAKELARAWTQEGDSADEADAASAAEGPSSLFG